jgi:SAM-dependent methyltransferase
MPQPSPPPPIFDSALVNRRLDRAWARASPDAKPDFLLARAAQELGERLSLIKRRFAIAADIGSPGPHGAAALAAGGQADCVIRLAPTEASLGAGEFFRAVGDLERLPVGEGRLDLAVSLLALQTVNDLPGALIQMRRALKADGLLMAAMLGGDSLTELRQSLTIAESEILGGAAPRVAPFVDVRALGGLAQRAGLALPVVDLDRSTVRYSDILALMNDLRAFGAANALHARSRKPLRRDVLARAGAVYAEQFADPDGRLRATFDILWLSGWAPHESQPKPLQPGSAKTRLADALKGGGAKGLRLLTIDPALVAHPLAARG